MLNLLWNIWFIAVNLVSTLDLGGDAMYARLDPVTFDLPASTFKA
jgi:hypothetical protein